MAARRKPRSAGKPRGRKTARKPTRKAKAPARRKAGRKSPAKKSRGKAAARARSAPPVETVARRIVRFATNRGNLKLADLYSESATSREAGPNAPAEGLQAIEAKLQTWESMLKEESWTSQNVWIKGNTIAIEWKARVTLQNGKTLEFDELAVHEVRGGKIVAERYYYDPSLLQQAMQEAPAAPAPRPEPMFRPEPAAAAIAGPSLFDDDEPADEPETPVDPLDL